MQHCLHDPMFSRFGTMPACDRQTDGQTHDDSIYQASTALCSKNYKKLHYQWHRLILSSYTTVLLVEGELLPLPGCPVPVHVPYEYAIENQLIAQSVLDMKSKLFCVFDAITESERDRGMCCQ